MISKRLKAIADLVPNNKSVIDIGTDHAYIPIYLYQENITKDITASDISAKVLDNSFKTLAKFNLEDKIPLILSDGLKNIDRSFDVAIIAGMGTSTIIDILKGSLPNILIIESNNNHYQLRKFMVSIGYKIDVEKTIKDKKHYYVIIRYIKGTDNLTEEELLFGKSKNIDYYKHLIDKYSAIYNKSKDKKYLDYINILKKIIEKIPE